MTEATIPRPAATVVLLRPSPAGLSLLLTKRPASMAFAPDLHVFPGGAVDPGDADPRLVARSVLSPSEAAAALGGDIADREALAKFIAAIRELFEEAGVLLAEPEPDPGAATDARVALLNGTATLADVADELGLRLRTDLLALISSWTTPPVMPRQFETSFFAADLPSGVEATFTTDEVVDHRWSTPLAGLEAMAAGEIELWPPTAATLQQLAHAKDLAEIRHRVAPGPIAAPRVIGERPDIRRIVVSAAGGVPGQVVNTYLAVAGGECAIVDPGDPSDEAARAIVDAATGLGARPAVIALTHVDPDHAAGAAGLSLTLDIPVVAGLGAARFLPYPVGELADGEVVTMVGGAFAAVATPGPRPDHLAFRFGDVVFAGDLVGGRGDRSIFGAADLVAWDEFARARHGPRPGPALPGPRGAGHATGSDACRFRRKLRPSSTSSCGAYGPGIRKHGRPARATPWSWPHFSSRRRPAVISAARL